MLIDWFTVAAQVVNFIILVWLMKRFLYKPILHAIDEREKYVAAELEKATTNMAEAQEERDIFKRKNESFDQQRASLMGKATDEVHSESQRLFDEARQSLVILSSKQRETLVNEKRQLHQAICVQTKQQVFSIVRKTLTDLAGVNLEERMAEVFLYRLRELDEQAKFSLADNIKASSGSVNIRSSFDLSEKQCSEISTALADIISSKLATENRVSIRAQFETEPDLISGIELNVNGQKVAWSIADYLTSLEIECT